MLALHAPSRPHVPRPTIPTDAPLPTVSPTEPLAEPPIQSRIWHLYCQGHSQTAIAEQIGLERHAVARHLHAVETMLAREHADDLALARHRALDAAYSLFATALHQLTIENQREDALWRDYERALAGLPTPDGPPQPLPAPTAPRSRPRPDATGATNAAEAALAPEPALPPVPVRYYRAGSTRLLTIALAALRHAIRLSGVDGPGSAPTLPAVTLPTFPLPPVPSAPPPSPSRLPPAAPNTPAPAAPAAPHAPAPAQQPASPAHPHPTPPMRTPPSAPPLPFPAAAGKGPGDEEPRAAAGKGPGDEDPPAAAGKGPGDEEPPAPAGKEPGHGEPPNIGTFWNISTRPHPTTPPSRPPSNPPPKRRKRPAHH